MIYVYCKLTPKADQMEEFLRVVKELIDKTRMEAGCASFDLVKTMEGPSYVLFERFNDRTALEEHVGYDYFKELFPRLKGLLEIPPEATNHELVY